MNEYGRGAAMTGEQLRAVRVALELVEREIDGLPRIDSEVGKQ